MKRKISISALIVLTTLFTFTSYLSVARKVKKAGDPVTSGIGNMKGQPAPDFTLQDEKGNQVSLSDFKGKVVYMDIWASWCAPCIMEMKNSEKLKNTFKDNKEVVFLNISIDNSKSKWKETLEKRNVKGINVLSLNGQEESIVEKYQVPAIPRFILVDKDGKIADFTARSPSSNKVESDIRKLL